MKGLAFKAPYGLALFNGKNIENRVGTIPWNHKGWICVYQSKTRPTHDYYARAVEVCQGNGYNVPPLSEMPLGVLLGVVWFDTRFWGVEDKGWGFERNWWFPVSRQHLFTNPIPFKAKFMLGLFEVPDEVIAHELQLAGIDLEVKKY